MLVTWQGAASHCALADPDPNRLLVYFRLSSWIKPSSFSPTQLKWDPKSRARTLDHCSGHFRHTITAESLYLRPSMEPDERFAQGWLPLPTRPSWFAISTNAGHLKFVVARFDQLVAPELSPRSESRRALKISNGEASAHHYWNLESEVWLSTVVMTITSAHMDKII